MCLYMPRNLQACLGIKTRDLAAVRLETAQPIDPRSQEKTNSPDITQAPENSLGSWEASSPISQSAAHRARAASKRRR